MKLSEFIDSNFGGNQAEASRFFGKSKQQIGLMIKKGTYYVFGNTVYIISFEFDDLKQCDKSS